MINMDSKALDAALNALVEKKVYLNSLKYDDDRYDEAEDALHEAEDAFLEEFGYDLEQILEEIHDEHFPESDVLIPTAYLAKNYIAKGVNPDGTTKYSIQAKEGIEVESEKYKGKKVKLVLLPNPARFIVLVDGKGMEILWQTGNN
jgi:hypothetical protein